MAVRSFRQRFPTAWAQTRTPAQLQATWARTQAAAVVALQAAATDAIRTPTRPARETQAPASLAGSTPPCAAVVAASHPVQATTPPAQETQAASPSLTFPAQETQPPASPAGSTPAERLFTPEETAVLNHLVLDPPPGVGERPAVPLSPAPSPTGPATAADSPRIPTPPPIVLQVPVDISQLGAAGGPLSPSSPLGVSRQPGWGSFDLNRPQDPQMWPDPTAPQAATSPAQQGPPLGPLATLPRPMRN